MAKAKTLELSIKIAGEVDKSLTNAIEQTQNSVSSLSTSLSKIGTVGLAAMGVLATGTVAAIVQCTNVAEEFESNMASVVKYVDGLADDVGEISNEVASATEDVNSEMFKGNTYAENYEVAKKAILDLSTEIPYTAEELTQLAAAAGQSGKSLVDLFDSDEGEDFLRDVAMWGVAMDVDAEQAGDWAAKWEVAFGMTHEEVMDMADIINYLGANSATTAAEIAEVVNDTVSLGEIAGVDATTTAALADAMLAMGVDSSRASTSIKRMYTNLTKGYAASSTIQNAFAKLGMDAVSVAESMAEDGTGTILEIFEAIQELPESEQLATISSLFGQWAVEGAGKIVGNIDTYIDALEAANDPDLYKGSMEREFTIKSGTTESADLMLSNAWYALREEVGEAFLPVKSEFDYMLIDVINGLRDNMPTIESIAESMATVLSEGVTALGNALENALPYIQAGLEYVANNGTKVAGIIAGLAGAFATMKVAPLLETLAGGLFSKNTSNLTSSIKNTVSAASIGANLANSSLTGSSGKKSISSSILGAIFGVKNASGLTGDGSDKSFMKSLASTAGQIIDAKEGGGLSGLFGKTGVGKYLGNIGSSVSGMFSGLLSLGAGDSGSLSGLGKMFSSFGSLATGMLSPVTSMFSGILSSALPVVAIVGSIIAVFSMLYDNIDSLQGIFNTLFGEEGPEKFENFKETVTKVVGKVNDILNGGLADALSGVKDKFVGLFDGDTATTAGDTFDSIVMIVQSVLGVVGQLVDFAVGTLRPIIEEVFNYLTTTVLPMILQAFNTAAPTISSIITNIGAAVMTVAQIIGTAIQTALPIIENIITVILSIASVAIPAVLSGFNSLWSSLSSIITSIQTIFTGLIEFITGVFTGDWEQAWTGVKDIFQGAFDALVELAKVPINAVISLINGAISGINSLGITIPDWVPKLGGQTFSIDIPEIPMLATGGFTSGPSIAGEAGTEAVISFDSGVRSENIDTWARAGELLGVYGSSGAELKEIDTSGSGDSGSVTFSPQITIQGNADQSTIDDMMSQMRDAFEEMMEQYTRQRNRVALR